MEPPAGLETRRAADKTADKKAALGKRARRVLASHEIMELTVVEPTVKVQQ